MNWSTQTLGIGLTEVVLYSFQYNSAVVVLQSGCTVSGSYQFIALTQPRGNERYCMSAG